ncbi:GATA transcription factor LreB [Aspergillus stella-maris]|uniref:GATA transcription factor LreB n=1 Tax=Aspergillus stella-maris TaxID=1810926 RepID=UPI003CCDB3C8
MDFTPLQLSQTHPYGLDADLASASYETPIGVPQLPRSLNSGFSLQPSSLNQSTFNPQREQPPWPQRVLNEVRDLVLLLSPDGIVNYVSPSCKSITGFEPTQLQQDNLSRFIHDDDKTVFKRELSDCIATASPLRCHFRIYQIDNSTCLMEAHGHPHISTLNNDATKTFCNGVFLVCRPYHTQSTQLLDSFLEHKLENIRLKERIAQLKKEEETDLNAAAQQTRLSQVPSTVAHRPIAQSNKTLATTQLGQPAFAPSQENPVISGEENESSDTLGNVDEAELDQMRAVLNEEPTSHLSGIELMTGLFLTEGERSQGISTGIPEGHLYNSTTSNTPLEPQVLSESEPRKRLKGEYQCADCGTSDSPEWRKGPDGPKTLCNACGLRWAKSQKKRQDS